MRFLGVITSICIGVGVPGGAIYLAFKHSDALSGWGWSSVTLISIVAIGCATGIFALTVNGRSA
ncbi:hypothetical protein AMJ71_09085 [candidate division TA06 bacterium SM1_40]|uniref:Uncharacterized protein n=1 Tax=candidate division TA06 bacterium SM1_40 TaxID=1703773 RepID=A0A0S8JF18_UNCT6|nr:MAG: hypothetical protein AMJ71_09085 [candidate division TA06 bacterium SM1_40]